MRKKTILILACLLLFLIGIIIGKKITLNKEKKLILNDNQIMADNLGIISIEKANNDEFTNNVTPIKVIYDSKINTLDKRFQIYGFNNNSKVTKIEMEIYFYDENGNSVAFRSKNGVILPNREYVIVIDYLENNIYNSYKLIYKAEEADSGYMTLYDENKITYSSVKTSNNEIVISYKNNNKKEIGKIYFSCILYYDKEIVGTLSVDDSNILDGRGNNLRCIPNNNLQYNDYKVILSQLLEKDVQE